MGTVNTVLWWTYGAWTWAPTTANSRRDGGDSMMEGISICCRGPISFFSPDTILMIASEWSATSSRRRVHSSKTWCPTALPWVCTVHSRYYVYNISISLRLCVHAYRPILVYTPCLLVHSLCTPSMMAGTNWGRLDGPGDIGRERAKSVFATWPDWTNSFTPQFGRHLFVGALYGFITYSAN